MRATIMPQENHIRIDDEPITVSADLMPAWPALDGLCEDLSRPIEVIMFDGAIGTIQRKSRAPGRVDVEHFLGAEPLKAYADVFAAEKQRLADEKRKRDEEEEARAQHSAELAAKAETAKTSKKRGKA